MLDIMPDRLSRSIVISSEINEQVAGGIIGHIMDINQFDAEMRGTILDYSPEPIEIIINSGGGSVTDGFAIIGAMEMSDTPIVTCGIGLVASMALAIFIAGDYRIGARHCRFMYHSVSYGMAGHITDHEDMQKETDLLQRMYNSLFTERTKFTKEQMNDIRAMKKDYFFSAKKALKLGVIDEITDKPERKLEIAKEPTEEQIKQIEAILKG